MDNSNRFEVAAVVVVLEVILLDKLIYNII